MSVGHAARGDRARACAEGVLAAVLACGASGCAAVINGQTSTIEVKTSTPGAKVYIDGFEAKREQEVQNDRSHILLVRAPGYADHVEELHGSVAPLPIVLDVIVAVPTLLIAPLVDIVFGTWYTADEPDGTIVLEKLKARVPRARPVYQVGSIAVPSTPGKLSQPATPAPSDAPPDDAPPDDAPNETPPGKPAPN